MDFFKSIWAVSVLSLSAGVVGTADAATCGTGGAFDTGYVEITSIGGELLDSSIEASDCAGAFEGNDTGDKGTLLTNLNDNDIFGSYDADLGEGWSLFGKSDEDAQIDAEEVVSGEWSIDFSPEEYSVFALSIKASDQYVVYLFDLRPDADSIFGGEFETTGLLNNGGQVPDLSHMTVAVWDGEVIPLPAAGWLLLGGLGGLAAMKRRRKS